MDKQTINKKNESVSMQYADSKNFMARVELNRRFGKNPYRWTSWVFDQIRFKEGARVLELGSGNALLWKSNLDKIPDDVNVLLSDFSSGMLKDARNVLSDSAERFEFEIIDAQKIPFPDNSFDIIIANFMLYHVPDRNKAISEISRVLKDEGTFYVTAFGLNNMEELTDLVFNFNNENYNTLKFLANEFGLENGKNQLIKYFKDVEILEYHNYLEVTEAEPLVNFILSSSRVIKEEEINDFVEYIQNILKNGSIKITRDSYMFKAIKPKL